MALRASWDSVFLVSSVISHTYQSHCLKLYPGPRADLPNFNCQLYDSHPPFSTRNFLHVSPLPSWLFLHHYCSTGKSKVSRKQSFSIKNLWVLFNFFFNLFFFILMSSHQIKDKSPTNHTGIISKCTGVQTRSEKSIQSQATWSWFQEVFVRQFATKEIHLVNFHRNYSWLVGFPAQGKPQDFSSRGSMGTQCQFVTVIRMQMTGRWFFFTTKPQSPNP